MKTTLEIIGISFAIIGSLFAAFLSLEDCEYGFKAGHHYRKLELTRELTPVEQQRKEFLERQIILKDGDAKDLEMRERDLKMKQAIIGEGE